MVALRESNAYNRQLSSVQFSLSRYVFSTVQFGTKAFKALRVAGVVCRGPASALWMARSPHRGAGGLPSRPRAKVLERVWVRKTRLLVRLLSTRLGMHLTQAAQDLVVAGGPRLATMSRTAPAVCVGGVRRPIRPTVTVFRAPSRRAAPDGHTRSLRTFRKWATGSRSPNLWWLPESSAYPVRQESVNPWAHQIDLVALHVLAPEIRRRSGHSGFPSPTCGYILFPKCLPTRAPRLPISSARSNSPLPPCWPCSRRSAIWATKRLFTGRGGHGARSRHHGGLEAHRGHVGEKIGKQHLTYAQGEAAEITAMVTIGAADYMGLPVSTTHVLSSGVPGTMAANHSGLQWSTVRSLAMA